MEEIDGILTVTFSSSLAEHCGHILIQKERGKGVFHLFFTCYKLVYQKGQNSAHGWCFRSVPGICFMLFIDQRESINVFHTSGDITTGRNMGLRARLLLHQSKLTFTSI